MESDDEETFVTIGTQLELVDDDAPKKKPIAFHDLPVKDKQGKVRFHGAFTGGFSAGYFNSVGSKDGWSPSTFVSSRDKHEGVKSQRPEDFMDEEDFSEHGIAPRKHQISDNFSSEVKKRQRIQEANAATSGTVISGAPALADLIVPEKLSVGIKLLRKLGWKEGQGIGPRRQKKRNITKKTETQPGVKVYGCILPSRDSDSNSEDLSGDEDLSQITFAPKDVTPISLVAKDNVHGIGYRGIDPRIALPSTHISLFEPPPISKSGRKAIRGHAFGVGALEEDDEDIYATDHLSNYDITMGGEEDKEDLFGWTAPGRGGKKKSKVTPIGYIGKVLEGFTLSSQPLKQKKSYAPPSLPPGYRPVCRLVKPVESMEFGISQSGLGKTKSQDAVSRGLVLGETPVLTSVFDLVSKEDRDKMHTVKASQNSDESTSTSKTQNVPQQADPAVVAKDKVTSCSDTSSSDSKVKSSGSRWDQKISSDNEQQSLPLFRGGDLLFKPFIKDSKKQERYDKYQHLIKQGVRDAYAKVMESHMTEWEQKREEEEFIKASKLYKPMSGMIASRFTRAKYQDDDESVELPAEEGDKSDKKNAAEMKMYGQLTRSSFDWHPDKVLCKRFNVPDPYPGSTTVGVPKVKRDKFSVFNFLNFTGSNEQILDEPLALPASKSTSGDKDKDVNQRPEVSEQISFKICNKSRPVLGQSIFSSLMEDKQSKKSQNSTEIDTLSVSKQDSPAVKENAEQGSKVQDVTDVTAGDSVDDDDDDKPSMDLFEAIFGNTDSEDSAASDNEHSTKVKSDPLPDTEQSKNSDGDALQTPTTQTNFLPGAPIVIDTIAQRLSGPTDDGVQKGENSVDEYGPALPPKSTVAGSTDVSYTSGISMIDLTQSSHRKHKEKHKHKHKKEKTSKHKKSKHKKKQKKKEKKRKKKDEEDKSSSSDSQSDSEDDATLNREILNKLSAVAEGRRLKASDFM